MFVMLSETKHLAQGLNKRFCEILHVVQDDRNILRVGCLFFVGYLLEGIETFATFILLAR